MTVLADRRARDGIISEEGGLGLGARTWILGEKLGLDGNIWDLKTNGLEHTAQANEHLHLDTTRRSHGNVHHDQAGGRKEEGKEAQYCAAQHVNSNSPPKMPYQYG